jgi:DNA-binding NarL/FixJ family response regulator
MVAVRVVIVDDHAVVREGTRKLLEHDPTLAVVGETGSGIDALRLVAQERPDVVLLDLSLADISGIEVARRIHVAVPSVKIVVLSAYDDDDYVVAAIEAGVSAYLIKTVRGQEVIDTLHAVQQGNVVLHPSIAAKLRHSLRRSSTVEADPRLSVRELLVLQMVAKGMHNKEIAERLSISTRTVEGHLSHILTKLDVSSRTEAVLVALSRHWFTLDDPITIGSAGAPDDEEED